MSRHVLRNGTGQAPGGHIQASPGWVLQHLVFKKQITLNSMYLITCECMHFVLFCLTFFLVCYVWYHSILSYHKCITDCQYRTPSYIYQASPYKYCKSMHDCIYTRVERCARSH